MNGNEPAFATPPKVITELDQDPYLVRGQAGLTKRELFAAMFMQGMLSNESAWSMSNTEIAKQAVDAAVTLEGELTEKPTP